MALWLWYIYLLTKKKELAKGTPSRFPGTKVKMAGSEPLIKEADPHITKLEKEAWM